MMTTVGIVLPQALEVLWQFLLPLLPVYVLVFWPALVKRPDRPLPAFAAVLGWALALAAVMTVGGLLAVQATTVRTPYVFAFFLVSIVLLLRLAGYSRLDRAVRIAVLAPIALMAVVPVGLAVKAAVEPERCRRCFLAFDYDALAEGLRRHGFTGGTIVARLDDQGRVGGLRPHFSDSRLISLRYPEFVPSVRTASGQCALLWYAPDGSNTTDPALAAFVARELDAPVPDTVPVVELPIPIGEGRPPLAVRARLWTAEEGRCD